MKHGKDFYSWLRQVSQINERLYEDAALISRLLDQCAVRLDDLKLIRKTPLTLDHPDEKAEFGKRFGKYHPGYDPETNDIEA